MINLKVGSIIAIIAFLLSFIIGLFNRVSLPLLLLRPLIMAVAFFVLSCIVYFLLKNFIPELLEGDTADYNPGLTPGSRIDITEGDSLDYPQELIRGNSPDNARGSGGGLQKPVFMGAQADNSEDGLGNISDIIGKYVNSGTSGEESDSGMDLNAQDGYNRAGEFEEFSFPARSGIAGASSMNTPVAPVSGGASSKDALPDLDSMAGAFLPSSANAESEAAEYTPSRRQAQSKKASGWTGDFNPKEIAAGLRTVLNREKEG